MIYLNTIHKNCGKFFNESSHKNDKVIENILDISIIQNIFDLYSIKKKLFIGRDNNKNDFNIDDSALQLKLNLSIINIYKHRNDILKP